MNNQNWMRDTASLSMVQNWPWGTQINNEKSCNFFPNWEYSVICSAIGVANTLKILLIRCLLNIETF